MRAQDLLDALDERIGHRKLIKEALDEPIPGGASFAYVFGSGALILFLVQVVTGLVLAGYYSASATDAWASVVYIEQKVTMGTIVRGMHHYAAGGMVIVVVLHMLQVVIFGAYKAPREANWLAGLALFGLTLAFALTGYLLPWDQTGYWATKVATSIAGTVPVVGRAIQEILQGGNDYGNLTLTRFYSLHVVLLPLLTFGLIAVHVALFRKHGITTSAAKSAAALKARHDLFWPKQVLFDAIFAFVAIAAIAYYAVYRGAPLEAPAEPASNFIARPEWYFLFLFQLLKYFEGPLQVVGTVIVPGLVTMFLVVLPFLDRSPSRTLSARRPWVGAFSAGLAAAAALTILAIRHDAHDPKISEQKERSKKEAERALKLAENGVPAAGAAFMLAHDPLTRGSRVFDRECASCHALENHGPESVQDGASGTADRMSAQRPEKPKGPELTGYRSKAWIRQVLRDSDSPRLFGHTKVEGMKSFAKLSESELGDLVELVYSLRDEKNARPIAERVGGPLLEANKCTECHEFESADALEGPALFRYGSRAWVKEVVDHARAEHLYGKDNAMPEFEKRLSDEDREAVVTYLLSLEDAPGYGAVSRGAWPFVDDPGPVPTPRPKGGAVPDGHEQ